MSYFTELLVQTEYKGLLLIVTRRKTHFINLQPRPKMIEVIHLWKLADFSWLDRMAM